MVKVILESFGEFPIFNNLVSRKRMGDQIERYEVKFGPRGEYSMYAGYFKIEVFKVILGSFGTFPIFDNPASGKQQALERNIHLNQFYVIIGCHLVKQSVKARGLLVE